MKMAAVAGAGESLAASHSIILFELVRANPSLVVPQKSKPNTIRWSERTLLKIANYNRRKQTAWLLTFDTIGVIIFMLSNKCAL